MQHKEFYSSLGIEVLGSQKSSQSSCQHKIKCLIQPLQDSAFNSPHCQNSELQSRHSRHGAAYTDNTDMHLPPTSQLQSATDVSISYLIISMTVNINKQNFCSWMLCVFWKVAWSLSSSKHVEMLGWRIRVIFFPILKLPLSGCRYSCTHSRPVCVGMDGITD